jgi:hypothetical protein
MTENNNVPKQLTDVQLEYRRRRFQIFRSVVLFVIVPFVLTAIMASLAAPALLVSALFAITMGGVVVLVVYVLRVWRCPACGFALYREGTLGGNCVGCGVQLYVPRVSKSGRKFP